MTFSNTVYKKCYIVHKKLWRSKYSVVCKPSKILKTEQVSICTRSLIGTFVIFKSSSLYRYFKNPHSYFGYDLKKENKMYSHKKLNMYMQSQVIFSNHVKKLGLPYNRIEWSLHHFLKRLISSCKWLNKICLSKPFN